MSRGQRPAPARKRSLHDRALGLLSVRSRSRRELTDRLVRAGFERADVLEEVDRLVSVGLVDDEEFARALVDHLAGRRGSGVRGIKQTLLTKGLDAQMAERAIAALSDDDASRRDLGDDRPLEPRLSGFLLRRGHAPDVARAAARRALDIDTNQASP